MVTLALILIIAGTAVWVGLPLAQGQTTRSDPGSAERGELEARRRELMFALQDLDFELQTGKLSVEDHDDLRARLQAEAAEVLERMDAANPADAPTG